MYTLSIFYLVGTYIFFENVILRDIFLYRVILNLSNALITFKKATLHYDNLPPSVN